MYIQKINYSDLVSTNQQTNLSKKPCSNNNLKTESKDVFLPNKSNVTFGDAVEGGFWGYLVGSVVALGALAAAPVTGGLSMAAIIVGSQAGGIAIGSKIGEASDKK